MNSDKDQPKQNDKPSDDRQSGQELHLKNPFKPDEEVTVTQEELENEQEYKEALTERD